MKDKEYDFLVVGAGLFGAVFAFLKAKAGKKVLVIDKRSHLGGNIYCEQVEGINVHRYGAHIFHTSDKKVWDFVNSIIEFNRYTNSPVANYKGKLYNLPFNMNTFYQLWGVTTPQQAVAKIEEQRSMCTFKEPKNLQEQALSLVGSDIYDKLIKGYTEKQWGHKATDLPAFIIKRLPVRFTFDNNYFNDSYQGIPMGGYNKLTEGLLRGVEIRTNTDFFENREYFESISDKIVFTGKIDEFYGYRFGHLEYRSLRFEDHILDVENYQGNAVVNYTEAEIPYTRIIEHKHFEFGTQAKTVVTYEYPCKWKQGMEPYYPVNNDVNEAVYRQYKTLADQQNDVIFGGRLAEYKYYDMHHIVDRAMKAVAEN